MIPLVKVVGSAGIITASSLIAFIADKYNDKNETNQFVSPKKVSSKNGKIHITKNIKLDIDTCCLNVIMAGPPGIGKTYKFFRPIINSLTEESAVITDPSGVLKNMVADTGHDIIVISPYSDDCKVGWNPFKTCKDLDNLRLVLKQLLEAGYSSNDTKNSASANREWLSISETLLMAYAACNYKTQKYDLATFVNNLVTKPIFMIPDWYRENPSKHQEKLKQEIIAKNIKFLKEHPDMTEKEVIERKTKGEKLDFVTPQEAVEYIKIPPINTDSLEYEIRTSKSKEALHEFKSLLESRNQVTQLFTSIRTVLTASFKVFCNKKIQNFCQQPTLDISCLRKTPTLLFIEVPPQFTEAFKPVITIMIQQIITELFKAECKYETKDKVRPVFLLLDELGNIGELPAFDTTMTEGRKYRVAIMAGLQSILQLHHVYGENQGNIIFENFQTKIITSGLTNTADYFSKLLSNCVVEDDSGHTITKPLMSSDDLRCMDKDDVVIISCNKRPARDKLISK